MKITKGNLRPGDIVHFMDGNKYADNKYDIDFVNSHGGIDWLLTKPTPVKKVTRCNPWKKTGKTLDELAKAGLSPYVHFENDNSGRAIVQLRYRYKKAECGETKMLVQHYMTPCLSIHETVLEAYDVAKENGWL